MNRLDKNDYIAFVAKYLNILPSLDESEAAWKFRVSYSAVGLGMIASLHDYDDSLSNDSDNSHCVSMQHVRSRGIAQIKAYDDLYKCFPPLLFQSDEVAEQIRTLFIANGYALHKSNRLHAPAKSSAQFEQLYFLRGEMPELCQHISGTGVYTLEPTVATHESIWSMMRIEDILIEIWFDKFFNGLQWGFVDNYPIDVEFLNIDRQPKEAYWRDTPPTIVVVLCRSKHPIEPQYYLCRERDGRKEVAHLPQWCVADKEYLRIALGLQCYLGNMPLARVVRTEQLTYVQISYLMPPAEQNFFEMYSWPTEALSKWKRTFKTDVFSAFEHMLTNLGFRVQEVS